ncbi:hypothetical protein PMAYCL1PPCAC_21711, partial [Pristionchus mayeri]
SENDSSEEDDKELTSQELAEVTGQRCVRTHSSAYLRGWDNGTDWHVGAAPQCGKCEQWKIEQHKGKVTLRESCTGKYLRANVEGYVDMATAARGHELWTPKSNDDGTWSFKSVHGTWLRAQPHGRISLQTHVGGDEKFRLKPW